MTENVKGLNRENEILSGPDFFRCERFNTRMLKKRCVERQEGNYSLQSQDFITSIMGESFKFCKTCQQGQRIKDEIISEKPKPQRGKGDRKEDCILYNDCLGRAAKRDWKTFNCENCPLYKPETLGAMAIKEKIKNTRVCETDGCENITLGPNCPLCPSCMAKKSNEKRATKKTKPEKSKRAIKAREEKIETNGMPPDEKISPDGDIALTINFGKHASVLKTIEQIAEEELRSVNMQVIYMLKKQLENIQEAMNCLQK